MDSGLIAVLLLGLGLAVLVVEVFVPSGGLLAVFTLMCLVGSVVAAWDEWWGTDPAAFWLYLGSVVVLVPGTVVASFAMLPRTKFGRRLLQEAPTKEEIAPLVEETARLAALVGKRGVTLTTHSPGGMVEVNGQRHHAEARGLMLDPGQPIEVIALRGQRLVVRLADGPAPASDPLSEPVSAEAAEEIEQNLAAEAESPVAPVIEPNPARPGGDVSPSAPVGYPEKKPAAEPDRIDFEVPEDDEPAGRAGPA